MGLEPSFAAALVRRLSRPCPWRLLAPGLLALLAGPASTQEPPRTAPEMELKALFIINFARLTEWPAAYFDRPEAPLALCVDAVREPLLAALRRSGIDTVQGRPLQLRALAPGEPTRGCHVLFMDAPDPVRAGVGQLSIGDTPGFAQAGGVIALVRGDKRLRFEVNRDAAARAQLRLSSELLKLALPPGEAGTVASAGAERTQP